MLTGSFKYLFEVHLGHLWHRFLPEQINYFRWDRKEESSSDFFRFCCLMTKFRKICESIGLNDFLTAERLQWHGHLRGIPDWSETSRSVAFSLIDSVKREIYVAFNTSHICLSRSLCQNARATNGTR